MALKANLTDGTTTYNLLAAPYTILTGTLAMGNPRNQRAESVSVFGSRWDLVSHAFTKRIIRMVVKVESDDLVTLATDIENVQKALRLARQKQMWGVGNDWKLSFNPGGSAVDVTFRIQTGSFVLTPGAMRVAGGILTDTSPKALNIPLVLETDPFGDGPEETIENYASDPSFEVAGTALADWTESKTATGTTARDTTQFIYGAASLKLVMTDATAGQQHAARYQDVTVVAATTWSVGVWCEFTARSNSVAALKVQVLDGSSNVLWEDDDFLEAVSTVKVASLLSRINITIPTNGVTLRVWCELRSLIVDATGTAFYDAVMTRKAATLPTAWVSGRDVRNHLDDDGQAHLNYMDIEDLPGDYPAKLQIKATDNQVHTKFWVGARHDSRQYDAIGGIFVEGEDFATFSSEPSGESGNAYGRWQAEVDFDAASSGQVDNASTITLSHTVGATGQYRLLIVNVSAFDGTDRIPTGVTYDGVAMVKVADQTQGSNAASMWYLVAPSTGADDIVATFAGTVDSINMGGISFTGVDQTTPLGTAAKAASAGSDAPTVTVTTVARDMVVDSLAQGDESSNTATNAAGTYQTERHDVGQSTNHAGGAGSTEVATGTSTTMSWTLGNSMPWAIIGVAIKGQAGTAAAPLVVTKAISTPPKGTYRVLGRFRKAGSDAWEVAMGWAYGGITEDPSIARDYASIVAGTTEWHLLDIGSLVIPPAEAPDGATIGTFTLRLAFFRTAGTGVTNFDCDYIHLLPVDFGSAYTSKASAVDVVVVDTISRLQALSIWNTSDVYQSTPEQEGTMPFGDPGGTRLYFAFDNGTDAAISDGAKVALRYVPQHMVIG